MPRNMHGKCSVTLFFPHCGVVDSGLVLEARKGFVARHGMVALQGIGGTKPGRIPGTRVVAGWVHTS